MEEYSIEEVLEMQRQARRKRARRGDGMTQAERLVHSYLAARYGMDYVLYEPCTIILGGGSYTPDFVTNWNTDRIYWEVKEAAVSGKWEGFRIRETMAKLRHLRHVAEPFGHAVRLATIKDGIVSSVQVID